MVNTGNYRGDPTDITDDTPFDAMQSGTLRKAGVAYLLGDAALYVSGKLSGRTNESKAGAWWLAGGLAAAAYGNPSADKQMEMISRRLGDYLRKQNVTIPSTVDNAALTRPGGIIDNIEDFLYAYPSQMLNAAYAVGGALLAHSGVKHNKHWDTASGVLVMAGALAGLLISEKPADREHPPEGIIGKTAAWFREKPLRISSGFFLATDVALANSAYQEWKTTPQNKSYVFKSLTVASYIFANIMLAMTSKSQHSNGMNMQLAQKLADSAGSIIAMQPHEVQEKLIEQVSAFLSAQEEIKLPAADISKQLHEKLRSLSPVQDTLWQQRVSAPAPETTPPLQR